MNARPVAGSDGAMMPFWSPDGIEVGYVAAGRLWRAAATGDESVAIASVGVGLAGGSGVAWTDDDRIVFANGSTALMTVSARGGTPRALLQLEPGEQDHHEPHALPGGRGILFVPHRTDAVSTLVLLVDGERRELIRFENQFVTHPVYSATGHILFGMSGGIWSVPFSLRRLEVIGEPVLVRPGVRTPSADGTRIVYAGSGLDLEPGTRVRSIDGSGEPQWIGRGFYGTFSPAGDVVVTLGAPSDDDWNIGYLPADETEVRRIRATSALECYQMVSPDGRYLAYASNASGRWDVYLTRFPSGEGTWQVSSAGGSWPRWDPRGDRLYYAQGVDIMEVSLSATDGELAVDRPQRLFSRPVRIQDIRFGKPDFFDVTPNGERFLVTLPAEPAEGTGGRVIVVGDWRAMMDR